MFEHWMNSRQLVERWRIHSSKLYDRIMSGLPAYPFIDGERSKLAVDPFSWQSEFCLSDLHFLVSDVEIYEAKFRIKPTFHGNHSGRKEISPEIIRMISEADPEIKKLYKQIKKISDSGRETKTDKDYKSAVMEYFRENKNEFKLIKESYLSARSLYAFQSGQRKRDFIGKVLQNIANDLDLGINNYQKLYIIYKKLTK